MRVQRQGSQALQGGALWQDKRQWAPNGTHKVPPAHQETLFYCAGDQAVAQVAKRTCEGIVLRGLQKLSGHGHGQPALGGPV